MCQDFCWKLEYLFIRYPYFGLWNIYLFADNSLEQICPTDPFFSSPIHRAPKMSQYLYHCSLYSIQLHLLFLVYAKVI